MKTVLHKSFSVFLAFLLLASTVSWKVEKHYCMGRIMDISFFVGAEDCGMEVASGTMTEAMIDFVMNCCDDQLVLVHGQDELASSQHVLHTPSVFYAAILAIFNPFLLDGLQQQSTLLDDYPPPLLVKNIQLIDQVFLI